MSRKKPKPSLSKPGESHSTTSRPAEVLLPEDCSKPASSGLRFSFCQGGTDVPDNEDLHDGLSESPGLKRYIELDKFEIMYLF